MNMLASRLSPSLRSAAAPVRRSMATKSGRITEGVVFDTIAREWRMKWSADSDKASLEAIQKELVKVQPTLKSVAGVKSVQRVVCGGCLDYKVIVSLDADSYGAWEARKFEPEESFLAAVKAIPGVSLVETQTYTLMPVQL